MVGDSRGNDVFSHYNKTKTRGGARVLRDMFQYPRALKQEIEARVNIIRFFRDEKIDFPFDNNAFDNIEFYLSNVDERTRLSLHEDTLQRKFDNIIGSDGDFKLLYQGILGTLNFLVDLVAFIKRFEGDGGAVAFHKNTLGVLKVLDLPELLFVKDLKFRKKLSYAECVKYDQIFRFTINGEIKQLLYCAFDIDVFVAVAAVSREEEMSFAEIHEGEANLIEMQGAYHPMVSNAVANDIRIDESGNMIFLTGANMAGKSTIMKTFCIAVYLAHMGFPIPARAMWFSIQNGMFTTINLSDNLNMGLSHFYAEVNRVKRVAESIQANDRLIVVFDELFRGTNVKDAYEATVAISSAFANRKKCTFIISTHIIEAGEELRKLSDSMVFKYMPTVMNGHTPEYPYKISDGITNDRHGMVIIENEKILDIIQQKNSVKPGGGYFETDKQTLDDLNVLGKFKPNSIFSIFNDTVTPGGERLLERMFNNPLTSVEEINKRKAIFSFFDELDYVLPFDREEFSVVENYLRNLASKNRLLAALDMVRIRAVHLISGDEEYKILVRGLEQSIEMLFKLREIINGIGEVARGTAFEHKAERMKGLLSHSKIQEIYNLRGESLSFSEVWRFDYVLRGLLSEEMETFIKDIYELDVYLSVSRISKKRGLSHAQAVDRDEGFIDIKGVYHLAIPNAVANDILIDANQNVMFLTGANMAGKSTLMKSFAVAVYLAHMGFPVPAREMTFSLHDGMYTSINVPDDLTKGYSHFYSEVMRVKTVAEAVATNKQLLVIFDELFKGTNVKDAYDGTVAIVDSFSRRNSTFIISTHIMEAGQALKEKNDRLFFQYLPTIVEGSVPTYPYKLETGITDDRQGMMIIRNEKILEIINE